MALSFTVFLCCCWPVSGFPLSGLQVTLCNGRADEVWDRETVPFSHL